jgi:hypothetical protein
MVPLLSNGVVLLVQAISALLPSCMFYYGAEGIDWYSSEACNVCTVINWFKSYFFPFTDGALFNPRCAAVSTGC